MPREAPCPENLMPKKKPMPAKKKAHCTLPATEKTHAQKLHAQKPQKKPHPKENPMPRENPMRKTFNLLAPCVCFYLFILSGCSKISLDEVSRQYYEGNAKKAYELAKKGANAEIQIKEASKTREIQTQTQTQTQNTKEANAKTQKQNTNGDELLWQIQSGIIAFDLEEKDAETLLEIAEANINQNELEGVISSFFKNTSALLINDNAMPYKGFLYEGVMVNYYKALLYMSEQKYADARVEFNRASDRQRRIKEYYEKEIAKTKEAQSKIASEEKNKGDAQQQQIQKNQILQTYSNLGEFASLHGYINPAIDYIAGIFFMLQGDYAKAQDFLKESYGITRSSLIEEDLKSAQNRGYKKKQTWIIIEDGKSPRKIEKRFDLPIFTGQELLFISLALPDIKKGVDFASSYTLASDTQQTQARKISTLTPLVFNEFNKQIPFIITRGILSATIKTLTQYLALKSAEGNDLMYLIVGLSGIFYTQATAQADLRIATTLPNSFYVLRMPNTEGTFNLKADDKIIASIDISSECEGKGQLCIDKNNIVYIRNAQKNIFKRILFSK